MSEVVIERAIRRRGVFVLRVMSSQRCLGSKGILVSDPVLRSNVLEDLLVDVKLCGAGG
jgi:hypothetical protein